MGWKSKEEENILSVESHLAELERRHGKLDREIKEAQKDPTVDDLTITALKRRKLSIKDEIVKLRRD